MMRRLTFAVALLGAAITGHAQDARPPPLPEAKDSTIGYPTVAAALKDLRGKPGVKVRVENGWTIAEDRGDDSMALWSFTPEGHPAHPAAVKRTTFEKEGQVWIDMKVLCQAAKEPCDTLVREFQELNDRIKASMQQKTNAPTNPRDPEVEAFTTRWLDMLEKGRASESFALLTDTFKANLTPDTWRSAIVDTKAKLGTLKNRKLRRIVWYQDPKDAPLPGTYVAVEFDSSYENAEKHFRYVILHSLKGEPFKVMRDESTFVLSKAHNE
jgi:hypothetical protein